MRKTRVLVVDDSLVMRSLIKSALMKDPEIEIVGQAADPLEAREAIKSTNPDVVTLDIEMPKMDGLSFLRQIMRLRPTPVVMVSNLTQRGAESTLRALELGAVDCVCKPGPGAPNGFETLPLVIKNARTAQLRPLSEISAVKPTLHPRHMTYLGDDKIIAIGASTGGVDALMTLIASFPERCPPTLITQHMPGFFTKSFAERLNSVSAAYVREAADGAPLTPGHIYLAPGDHAHLELAGAKGRYYCRLISGGPVNGHRPSVDILFNSVARTAGANAVGVILTGMGRDGAQGLLEMSRAGALTIGQDENSCLIYGMPRAAFELGAVHKQAPLTSIARLILNASEFNAEGG